MIVPEEFADDMANPTIGYGKPVEIAGTRGEPVPVTIALKMQFRGETYAKAVECDLADPSLEVMVGRVLRAARRQFLVDLPGAQNEAEAMERIKQEARL